MTGRNIQNERLLTSHNIESKFVGNSLIITDQIRAELEIVVFAMHYSPHRRGRPKGALNFTTG